MSRFVIVAYRPKPGQEAALRALVEKHAQVLREQDLISDQAVHIMRATDGTLVEVFAWRSAAAIEAAHSNPVIQALWAEFAAACDYVPLASLREAQQMFAEFDALH